MKKHIIPVILAITLLTFASCAKTEVDVPQGMQRASGEYTDYNLFVPDSWQVETSTGVVTAKYSDSILVNVSLMAATLENKEQTPDEYFDEYSEKFSTVYEDFNIEAREDTLLDSHAAKKFVYTGKVTGVDAKYMQVVCIKSGIVYLFTYTASPDRYDKYLPDVEKMLEHFSFKS